MKVCKLILCDSLLPGVRWVDYVGVRLLDVIFHMLILNYIESNGYLDYSFNVKFLAIK